MRHRGVEDIRGVDSELITRDLSRLPSFSFASLRAATGFARLWRDQSKRDKAHDLLAPVYGWFTEGFHTRNLKEAKALLGELHA